MVGVRHDAHGTDELKADLREAYERGRRDERAMRKRHPVLMTFTFIAAAVGLVLMALAAVNGSFSGAGGVVDKNLAVAANKAEPAVRDAASNAGQAVRDVGQDDNKAATTQPAG
jgi:hypothetical protein